MNCQDLLITIILRYKPHMNYLARNGNLLGFMGCSNIICVCTLSLVVVFVT